MWGRGEAFAVLWWAMLRERDHLGDPGIDGRIILRSIFSKWDVEVWTSLSWLRMGTGGGRLRMSEDGYMKRAVICRSYNFLIIFT